MSIKLDHNFFENLVSEARISPRKRSHYNLHKEYDEPVQRLCIALTKGTYVRPHHHPKSNKWELMLVLRGSVNLIIFDREGFVLERLLLSPGDNIAGIELTPNTWHTIIPVTVHAVIMEVKEGPFTPTQQSDFASWAPEEGDAQASTYLKWLEMAKTGDQYTL